MTITLSHAQLRITRLRSQLLAERNPATSPQNIVSKLCAIQAQEWPSAQLAIAARSTGITATDIKRAREIHRTFILTWSLRGTLHLVPAQDLGWLLSLSAPKAISSTKRRYQQLQLSENIRAKSLRHIADILSQHGPLTRPQLADKLTTRGIPVAGQAIHHLLRYAALRGLICIGPERATNLTYTLLSDRLPNFAIPPDAAPFLPTLARRYLQAHAPATASDFARWSSLSAAQTKSAWTAIAPECATVSLPNGEALILKTQLEQLHQPPEQPILRFLPRYDNYLLGYASRQFMVTDAHAKRLHPGGGLIRASLIANGKALANWRIQQNRKTARIITTPFDSLDASLLPPLRAEAQTLAPFLQRNITLHIE